MYYKLIIANDIMYKYNIYINDYTLYHYTCIVIQAR